MKTLTLNSIQNLDGFEIKIIGNKDNNCDVYDIAFDQFKDNSNIKAEDSELNVLDPFDIMRPSMSYTHCFTKNGEKMSVDKYKKLYTKIIFRQSLVMDCSQIETLWKETLSIGTDTYRLKFHNKLISTYQGKENTLSKKDCFVIIESYHNAASTYYFSRVYITALFVIEDGLKFGLSVLRNQFNDEKIDGQYFNSWLWLCESLKQDILVAMTPENRAKYIGKKSTGETFKQPIGVFYSSASALFYRRYFLDDALEIGKKKALEDAATKKFKTIEEKDIIYTQYNSMYNFLILAKFGKTFNVKLENAIKAIQSPVLSTEDRLLNYKALLITMEMTHLCLDESGLLAMSDACGPFNKLRDNNIDFRDKIIPKLRNVYFVMHENGIIDKLIANLSKIESIFNERILHVIVTSAVDFAEVDPEKYATHIKNIKIAIGILESYIKVIKEANKIEKNNESEYQEIDYDDFDSNNPEQNYIETMDALFINATYSTIDTKNKNVFIAYKWLAELYGVLCDNFKHFKKYQNRLTKFIQLANKFSEDQTNINSNDDHLMYLKNKQDAKILLANNSWEISSWPGGWKFNNIKTETLNILYTSANEKRSKILDDLYFLRNSNCPYINKIEINILLYRLYVMNSAKSRYDNLKQYLMTAVHEVVVTSEDRARNMEAHELFSMYLMMHNRNSIEKMFNGKDYTNINNTFVETLPSTKENNVNSCSIQ